MPQRRSQPRKTAAPDAAKHRRKLFAEALLSNGGNKTEAALAAGFSPATAGQQGSRLFKHVEVQHLIEQARSRVEHKAELGVDDLAKAIRTTLLFDPRALFNPDGTLRPVHELPPEVAANLTGIDVTEETITEGSGSKKKTVGKLRTARIRWEGKSQARDQLARMLGAYEKDNRQRTDPLTQLLAELQGRRTALAPVEEPAP